MLGWWVVAAALLLLLLAAAVAVAGVAFAADVRRLVRIPQWTHEGEHKDADAVALGVYAEPGVHLNFVRTAPYTHAERQCDARAHTHARARTPLRVDTLH
jgi:hypothetical protein